MLAVLRQLAVLAVIFGIAAWVVLRDDSSGDSTEAPARRAAPPPAVLAEAARLAPVERVVAAVGTGKARASVELRAAASGRVEQIDFAPGERVTKGALLLRLDDAVERAALAEAEADLDEARAARERAGALMTQKRITESAFETAVGDLARAEAKLQRARAALADRELRAPFDGVIGLSDLAVGALAGRDVPVAVLEDLSVLQVEFPVPERFFAEVGLGDQIRAQTTIAPEAPLLGRVVAVERRVDEVTRAFRVRAEIPNPDLALPSGLFLRVTLVLAAAEGILAPETAVVWSGEGAHVFVLGQDGTVARRAVQTGIRRDGAVEIVSGLAAGERVVTRGIQRMRDGIAVRDAGAPDAAPTGAPRS